MEKKSDRFDNDELDDAVIAADDTGMIAEQHVVVEEELLESTQPDEDASEDER
jgi:hypothetical protein